MGVTHGLLLHKGSHMVTQGVYGGTREVTHGYTRVTYTWVTLGYTLVIRALHTGHTHGRHASYTVVYRGVHVGYAMLHAT